VRITLTDPGVDLRTDLSATADVITAVRGEVLAIPIIALTLMDASQFERIPVEGEEVQPEDERPSEAGEHTIAPDEGEDAPGDDVSAPIEGVYVVDGDRVRFRPVEVGIAGDNYFEVLDGLDEGETVVSGTYQAIRELEDGAIVRIAGASDNAAEDGPGDSER
jgi:HlyD family secretion protein